jgi:hypothetical protein
MQSLHLDILNFHWTACAFHEAKQFLTAVNLATNITAVNTIITIPIFIMIIMLPVITVVTISHTVTAFGKQHLFRSHVIGSCLPCIVIRDGD